MVAIADLVPYAKNARTHSKEQVEQIAKSLTQFGWTNPVLIKEDGTIIAGHGRVMAAKLLGQAEVPCIRLSHLSDEQAQAYVIADNKLALNAGWDEEILASELKALLDQGFQLDALGFSDDELGELLLSESDAKADTTGSLGRSFGVAPFSVLNAREGAWQERKAFWLGIGMKSELGRDASVGGSKMVSGYSASGKRKTGMVTETDTSIFDPVLCELCYSWFAPLGGTVIDPFAGGSVRGIVAAKLGRQYIGQDLRAEQVQANREQAETICQGSDLFPVWIAGDSRGIDQSCKDVEADMLMTCPPYADLEVYSDDPADLSTMKYADFREAYFEIIRKACSRLKENSFAVCVVGEVRDRSGNYHNFVGDTIKAFRDAGLEYYNEMILVTAVGSLPIRVGKQFSTSRKIGKTHQNVLVFVKGEGKKAAEKCGKVEVEKWISGTDTSEPEPGDLPQ